MNEISPEQLEANRQNAKLGGVKTEEGKAISKFNALKHGLLSKEVLLKGENENALIEIGKRLRLELEPQTELEMILVDRITANIWRLKRVMQIEREMMANDINKNNATLSFGDSEKTLGGALSNDFANADTYGKLIRYEASIERGIYRAVHELQRLQSVHTGEKLPAPVVVDVDISKE